jgi:TRAP-type C4-dicarboxylate transport system, periplasmic component
MRQYMAGMVAVLLLAVGCAAPSSNLQPAIAAEPVAELEMILLLEERSPQMLAQGAALFCEKAAELSEGKIRISIVPTGNPAGDLQNGGGQLAFVNPTGRDTYPILHTTAMPFLFPDYTNLSRVLNSENILTSLQKELQAQNAVALAGYYLDSGHIISTIPLSNLAALTEAQETGTVQILTNGDSAAPEYLLPLNIDEYVELGSSETHINMLLRGEAQLALFRYSELYDMQWIGEFDSTVYFNVAFAELDLRWLLADKAAFDGLSASAQAVLQESAAYLFAAIDQTATLRDSQVEAMLQERGAIFNRNFSSMREQVFRVLHTGEFSDEQLALLEKLRELSAQS